MMWLDDPGMLLLAASEDGKQLSASPEGAVATCDRPAAVPVVTDIVEPTTAGDVATAAGRRHYVNLAQDHIRTNLLKRLYGPYVTLRARVAWSDPSHRGSLAGQQVRWTFTPRGGNLGAPPGYVTHKANASVGFWWFGMCCANVDTTVQDDGYTDPVCFYVGNVGGNGFTVTATSVANHASAVTTGVFEVWRKIPLRWTLSASFTQQNYHQAAPLAEVGQYFAPGFVEVVEAPDDRVFARWLTYQIRRYDYGMNRLEQTLTFTLTQGVYTEDGHFRRLQDGWLRQSEYSTDGGTTWNPLAPAHVTRVPLASHSDGLPRPAAPANPDDYTDDTAYSTEQDLGPTTATQADRVRITDWQLRSRIRVDITALGLNPSVHAPVLVRLSIRHTHYTSGDASATPLVAFGYLLESMTINAARDIAGLVVSHEIGHKLGFYPPAGPQYLNLQGPHCNDRACVMYWKTIEGRKLGWCAHCVDLLRQTNASVLALDSQ